MKQVCKYCKTEKSLDCFEVANTVKGKEYRRLKCKDCYGKTKKIRQQGIRLEVEKYKKTKKCEHCNMSDHRCLDFHHTRDKEFNIGMAVSSGIGLVKIFEEIAKCQILCANCHRIVHYEKLRS